MTGQWILVTTPQDDDAVYYCNEYSKEIIENATKKGFTPKVLSDDKATRKNVESYLSKSEITFVMLNGHGMPEFITGYRKEIILKAGENEAFLKGKITYARSCFALGVLGKASVEAGAKAFIGYRMPFMFVSDPTRGAHPLKDEFAQPCFTASNIIPNSMIKGNAVSESVERSKAEAKKLRVLWETKDLVEAPLVAACIHWNSTALGFEGDGKAKL